MCSWWEWENPFRGLVQYWWWRGLDRMFRGENKTKILDAGWEVFAHGTNRLVVTHYNQMGHLWNLRQDILFIKQNKQNWVSFINYTCKHRHILTNITKSVIVCKYFKVTFIHLTVILYFSCMWQSTNLRSQQNIYYLVILHISSNQWIQVSKNMYIINKPQTFVPMKYNDFTVRGRILK